MSRLKIVIDGMATGFNANGGSYTTIKSAEVLAEMGHKVYILSDNYRFNWFTPRKAKVTNVRPGLADVTIATGWRSVPHVLRSNSRLKVWWIRGWETWSAPEDTWIRLVKTFPNIIVNSRGLLKRVKKATGRKPAVIYPGLDSYLYVDPEHRAREQMGIGALNNGSKKTQELSLLLKALEILHKRGYRIVMFGTGKAPKVSFPIKYYQNPTKDQKRKLYNLCDVWLAASTSQGLHIPPMEAGLCGCALVCTAAPYGGTSDYAVDGSTATVLGEGKHCNDPMEYANAAEQLLQNDDIRWDMVSTLRERLAKKICSRKRNMERFVKLFKELLKGEKT